MRLRLTMAVFLGLASHAFADFSVVQSARMQIGERQAPTQRITVFQKGKKTRYDINSSLTVILDEDSKRRITLDRAKKLYSLDSWEPTPEKPLTGPVSVKPSERRTNIAGHPARLYFWTTNMGDISVSAEIWCAEDLPRVSLPSITGGGFDTATQNKELGGHPLRVRLVTKTRQGVQATLTSEVVAVSTRELAESYFEIPAGYSEDKKNTATKLEGDK